MPDVTKRTFAFRVAPRRGHCSSATGVIEIQDRKNRIVLIVTRDALAKQPAGWLAAWTAGLERQGCLATGDEMKLAERIVGSVPLELNASFRLLHGSQVDIGPQSRLEVVEPGFSRRHAGNSFGVGGGRNNRKRKCLDGDHAGFGQSHWFETAWYGMRPNADRAGFSIVPLRAERNVQGKIEPLPGPAANTFAFPPDAKFYRLFYKADQTEFTALAVAARTQGELEERTKVLESGPASCKKLNDDHLCLRDSQRRGCECLRCR